MRRLLVFAVSVVCLVLVASSCGGSSSPSPIHVAAVFADGEDHGDFRQSCAQIEMSVVKKNWQSESGCEAYFTVAFAQTAYSMTWGGYKIIPHSEKIVGNTATVRMRWPGGIDVITLVKTRAGWKVESVA